GLGYERNLGNAKNGLQLLRRDLHRTGAWRGAGFRLRKGRGHGRVKGDVALHLLHYLMNVAVKHCDGPEAFEHRERLLAVLSRPAPVGIQRPQRNMGEDDDRRTRGPCAEIVGEPGKLRIAELADPLQRGAVVQADEMHAFVIETVPAPRASTLAVAVQKLLPVIDGSVVLAGHAEDALRLRALEHLIHGVEFSGLRAMAEIAGVYNELRRARERVDLVHGEL